MTSDSSRRLLFKQRRVGKEQITEIRAQHELGASLPNSPIVPIPSHINSNRDIWSSTRAPMPFNPDDLWCPPSDLWDNLTIPYSAYFPNRCPTAGINDNYSSHVHWDKPVQNHELTPEPVLTIEEPIAGPSHSIAPSCSAIF
ncbi:hypothetical protein ARMGADRAFT_1038456 [Armillaria gallica]|uniref:Uncharacterized protein n=1 Tax=Armillaria gallica TaxID=47427 RepID=A0A2H3D2X0_ARMGA|nr:hypothetical protein ARMGADRAFT_1038456 [Armillaria gallica]